MAPDGVGGVCYSFSVSCLPSKCFDVYNLSPVVRHIGRAAENLHVLRPEPQQ